MISMLKRMFVVGLAGSILALLLAACSKEEDPQTEVQLSDGTMLPITFESDCKPGDCWGTAAHCEGADPSAVRCQPSPHRNVGSAGPNFCEIKQDCPETCAPEKCEGQTVECPAPKSAVHEGCIKDPKAGTDGVPADACVLRALCWPWGS